MPGIECYLSSMNHKITLVCKRKGCGLPPFAWTKVFPNGTLPEEIVIERAKHLATHGAEDDTPNDDQP
jgi:hypothetical protein